MNIEISWHQPTDLLDGTDGLTFSVDKELIPQEAGCYVFFNQHGKSTNIIYIGKAVNLQKRILQQFKTNVKLSNIIKDYGRGYKQLMWCTLKPGKRIDKLLPIVEKNLIKKALTDGHELINIQGSKLYYHEIRTVKGNRIAGGMFGRKILSEIK